MNKKAAAYPYLVWMVIFTVLPLILVVYYSLTANDTSNLHFTPDNFLRFFQPTYIDVLWRSIYLALICTLICFVLGYPVAYIMAAKEYRKKTTLLFLFLVPMWMNFLLRTYAWITILEKNGILNGIFGFLGLPKQTMLYTDQAVLLGMVYNFLPFMILPIHSVLKKMDNSLIEAAQDLGADNFKVFLKVVFPLSLPGVISGVTMVFMPAVTSFVIPNILGGGQLLIGSLIERQFLVSYDWHFGSAISLILMVIILITMGIFSRVDSGEGEGALF